MAVLCEAYSIVVRRDAIDKYFNDGWNGFVKKIPNGTMCTDEELVRVGFMDPTLANEYLNVLLSNGLRFDKERDDLTLVDQNDGPLNDCKWVQFLKTKMSEADHDVSMCWLWEGHKPAEGIILKEVSMKLATPEGWKPGKTRHKAGTDNLEFLRSEDGMDVYWNPETEEEEFTVQSNNKD